MSVHHLGSDNLALSFTPEALGFFSWDITKSVRHHDQVVSDLFGIEAHGEFGHTDVQDMLNKIHPSDRERVSQAVHSAIVTGDAYQQSYRVLTPSGKFVEIAAMGRCLQDEIGLPTIFVGIVFETKGIPRGDSRNGIRHHLLVARHLATILGNGDTSKLLTQAIRSLDLT